MRAPTFATTRSRRLLGAAVLVGLTLLSLGAYRLARTLTDSPLFLTFGYVGVFLLTMSCSATLLLPVPAFGVIAVAGSVLNPLLVGIIAGAGAATGELTGYLAGRSGRLLLDGPTPRLIERLRGLVERHGFLTLFVLSAIPNPLFDLAGLTAGSTGYSPRRYLIAVALGKATIYTVIALAGEAIMPLLS